MSVDGDPGAQPLWQPTAAAVATSNLTRFTAQAEAASGRAFASYGELHRWSIEDPAEFWSLVWRFTDVRAASGWKTPVRYLDRFPGTRWFEGAQLNFAENLLRYRDDRPALIAALENGHRRTLSYADLYRQTASIAAWLTSHMEPGDRVAGWLPNVPETVIAMLATTALGGVWSSCSPDFGADGALDRFGQIQPRVLFACDGYRYNGKTISTVEKMLEVARQIPSIDHIVWVSILDQPVSASGAQFDDLLLEGAKECPFVPRAFADPLYVMYSSGTTGKPKCIVHGVGGTLIQHLKEHQLHTDLTRDDALFFFTTCGWMMWNWLVSGLATGCTLVLYDGSPFHPRPHSLLDLADETGITVFGVSARYLAELQKAGAVPMKSHDLSSIRCILSTGSPLAHESFRYVYRDIKRDVHLASITGGTDIVSCFVLGNPTLPVWEGELQSKGLGMAVDVFDDDGRPAIGEKGELVCTRPFPSCPIGFWDDPSDQRFREAYFSRFPGVWSHGDFAEITGHGGLIVHGRSDAVLNPGGVRIGTAEIYRQMEQIDAVQDSICVGQSWEGDTRVVLFVVMKPGRVLDRSVQRQIRERLREHASPRHVPAKILEVPEIPRTLSGKIVELAVREVVHGRPVNNTSALANPDSLAHFRDRPELAD